MTTVSYRIPSAHFLPLEPASSKDYGKMFINNKKVERNPKEYQAVVEVLPEGWLFVAPPLLIFDLSQAALIQSSYASYREGNGLTMFVSIRSMIFDLWSSSGGSQVSSYRSAHGAHPEERGNESDPMDLPYPIQKSTSLIVCKDGRGRSGQVR